MIDNGSHKIGLACAGGGVEGAVYEIGALCALEDAILGLDFRNLHVYVGVSAGALITANLVNNISPRQMSLAILSRTDGVNPISPEILFQPAFGEFVEKISTIPAVVSKSILKFISNIKDNTVLGMMSELTELLPVGLFDNSLLERYLKSNFETIGITNDFREVKTKLRVVATELDSGKAVRFGEEGFDHIPISKAVQASTALPGIYLPVEIEGKYYVDGVARRTVHASVALKEGSDLVFCINPIVPLDSDAAEQELKSHFGSIRDKGLPTVLSQIFRTMIYSRMKVGISNYGNSYPDKDIVLFEPKSNDYRMFYTNVFSYSTRKDVCEHAYNTTLNDIRNRREELSLILEKYDLMLNDKVLDDKEFNLYSRQLSNNYKGTLSDLDSALNRLEAVLAE